MIPSLRLFPGEPDLGPWVVAPTTEVVALVRACAGGVAGPAVVAVDGRSASGKSTLADRLAAALPQSALIHTDDVAWYESFFGWDDLLTRGVLVPARAGLEVTYRPPAWDERHRPGAIRVPAGTKYVVVEGVGAGRTSLRPYLDAIVWVASDAPTARSRGIARDGGPSREWFWDEWDAQEVPFLAAEQPWSVADVVACGTPEYLGIDLADDEVLLSATTR